MHVRTWPPTVQDLEYLHLFAGEDAVGAALASEPGLQHDTGNSCVCTTVWFMWLCLSSRPAWPEGLKPKLAQDGGYKGTSVELEDDPLMNDVMSTSGFLLLCSMHVEDSARTAPTN